MIIERDNKKYFIDSNNREFLIEKREYPLDVDFYETRYIGTKARTDKYCEFCSGIIPKGIPHENHHFYPEFYSYTTHKECSEPFMLTLPTQEEARAIYESRKSKE